MTDIPLTRRRAETQARLLDAAMGAFADRGVLAATVEEICDRAGYPRGAFYSNFASKDDLVLALFKRDAETNTQTLIDMSADSVRATLSGSREELLETAVDMFLSLQHTERDWVIGLAEIKLYALREPGIREAYREYWASSRREMIAAMRTVQKAYGLVYSIPHELAVDFIHAAYEAGMLQALMLPEAENITDLKQLPPAAIRTAMEPLLTFLQTWIVEIGSYAPETVVVTA